MEAPKIAGNYVRKFLTKPNTRNVNYVRPLLNFLAFLLKMILNFIFVENLAFIGIPGYRKTLQKHVISVELNPPKRCILFPYYFSSAV